MSNGRIAVGTQEGLNIIENGEITKSYTADNGLEVSSVLCLLESKTGTRLIGSDGGGIYELDGDVLTNYGFDQGLSEGVVLRMLADDDGNGYFISAGSSLYYWNENGFGPISNIVKDAGSIFDFYIRDKELWILQNNGLLAFKALRMAPDITMNVMTETATVKREPAKIFRRWQGSLVWRIPMTP